MENNEIISEDAEMLNEYLKQDAMRYRNITEN